uniref:THAP domain-containing protein 1 n=1 Tax=Eptatretus burgeri TaxID=7764 RepID=A0A8C4QP69_EPTBU
MPARCIIAGCSNTTKDCVSLHVFPKDDNLQRIWTSKVKLTRGNWKGPSDMSVICSTHFEDSDFDHGLYSLFSFKKLRRLKPDAVPIIKSNVELTQVFAIQKIRICKDMEYWLI